MVRLLVAVMLALCVAGGARAQNVPSHAHQTEGDWVLPHFRFEDGTTLDSLRLHYTTLGQPRRDGNGHVVNAVLMLHGTTGTGKNLLAPTIAGELFGPGQLLDANRYYIILPDGLGRGGSSKPSDGLHAKFPRYGYHDVVEAQYRLVTEGLKVDHLRLVLGTSMGGMQTWMWGEQYPDMMDGLMPIASVPTQISGRNLLWRRVITEAIRHDPDWHDGEYVHQPAHFIYSVPVFQFVLQSAAHLQQTAPTRAQAEALYDRMVANAHTGLDANDFLYWFESSWDYDPEPGLGKIKAPLFAVNFADDAINPPELGILERLVPQIPGARFVMVPAGENTLGHQTLTLAAVWKPYLQELLASLPPVE